MSHSLLHFGHLT